MSRIRRVQGSRNIDERPGRRCSGRIVPRRPLRLDAVRAELERAKSLGVVGSKQGDGPGFTDDARQVSGPRCSARGLWAKSTFLRILNDARSPSRRRSWPRGVAPTAPTVYARGRASPRTAGASDGVQKPTLPADVPRDNSDGGLTRTEDEGVAAASRGAQSSTACGAPVSGTR